jgi:hypothetical protein
MWGQLALMAGGAALGLMREKQKANAMRKFNEGQAETTKWSPWTGMKGDIKPVFEDSMGAGLAGGLTGAQLGQGLGGDAKPTVDSQPSQMSMIADENTSFFNNNQFDRLEGIKDASAGNPWAQQFGRGMNMRA